jgi:polyphosphate:AMP phosphotransferase
MFEAAELDHKIAKETFEAQVPALRTHLLEVQRALKETDFPVIIVISGVDGAGKGETINLLNEWMDPRFIETHAFGSPSDEERERPPFWRFWRTLPARGRIGIFASSWYSDPIARRVAGEGGDAELDQALNRINAFERALADDGALLIKFWLHLSKAAQRKRLKKLEGDPQTRWRVTELDHKHLKQFDTFCKVAEHTLCLTGTVEAPWIIVEGADYRYRSLTVAQHLLERISKRLAEAKPSPPYLVRDKENTAAESRAERLPNVLSALDLSKRLAKETYKQALSRYQCELGLLQRKAIAHHLSSILVFEGWDAAGKGGIIRRITPAMDARYYQVIPIAAPTDEEKAHHYLWRFWRHLPRAGRVTLFDRSWYGRVLVERIEGFATEAEWHRGYGEISDFEKQLVEHGIVLVKYWIHIDKDEQWRRFQEREATPFKRHKITDEDWRNREKWEQYEAAVNDMFERTSTDYAPWTLIEGNDKRYARIKALKVFCEQLERALARLEARPGR